MQLQARVPSLRQSEIAQNGFQFQMTIADVDQNHAVFREFLEVKPECLGRNQVNGYCIRTERIDDQNIEAGVRLVDQRQASIAKYDRRIVGALCQVMKVLLVARNFENSRIDLKKVHVSSGRR